MSLRSSPALDYARGGLLRKESESWGRLKATFPLPQGLERLCGALPSGITTVAPGNEKHDPRFKNSEWPAGAATGQGWEPPKRRRKVWTHPDWRARKLYYSDNIDSLQLIFTRLIVLNSDSPAGRGFCNSFIRKGFVAPVPQLFCG